MIADGLRIVMLGAPGAGKGTQAQRMVSHFGIPQISTGEIFCENLKRNTPLGREIKEFMEKGELVPDDIVLKIVEERLSHGDCAKGFILDGFPRTLGQAKAFDGDVDVSCVINLSVDDKVLLERLAGRRTCRNCSAVHHISVLKDRKVCPLCGGELFTRQDDAEATITNRMKVYYKNTHPLIEYYRKKGKLIDVNSAQPPQAVFEEIKERIAEL